MQTLLKWEFYYNKSIGYTLKRRVQYAKVPLKSSHFNHLRCYFVVALDLQMRKKEVTILSCATSLITIMTTVRNLYKYLFFITSRLVLMIISSKLGNLSVSHVNL